jgi:hypothetical protein
MGNQVSAPASPPPNQCTTTQSEISQMNLSLQQKQRELDTCNPGQAQARRDAVAQQNSSNQTCAVAAQSLSQLNSDMAVKQRQVDECDPQAALQRRIDAATRDNQAFVDAQKSRRATTETNIDRSIELCDQIVSSAKPLLEYGEDLKTHITESKELLTKNTQTERKYRRQFLDGDPQEWTGFPGLRTSDDRVMLAFWICYSFAIITVTLVVMHLSGIQGVKEKIMMGVVSYGICMGAAYASIVYYG